MELLGFSSIVEIHAWYNLRLHPVGGERTFLEVVTQYCLRMEGASGKVGWHPIQPPTAFGRDMALSKVFPPFTL